jgi:glycosyltransferase involved in cell wall biosynthesis
MTDLQSFLIAPITRLFGTPHFLWYAHTHKSIYLKFANFFVNGIVTSTRGSCPIKSEKVVAIGQAIDEQLFKPSFLKSNENLSQGLHVGRLDPSKNLDLIFSEIGSLRKTFPHLSITQIGSPSTNFAKLECDSLRIKWQSGIAEGWISLKDSVSRGDLPVLFRDFDVFFHAYVGSLDKSLIEATMSGLPVVTINPEYLSEFGSWGKDHTVTLSSEYRSILSMSAVNYSEEVRRRYKIAQDRHSKTRWINSLVNVLMSEEMTNGRGEE